MHRSGLGADDDGARGIAIFRIRILRTVAPVGARLQVLEVATRLNFDDETSIAAGGAETKLNRRSRALLPLHARRGTENSAACSSQSTIRIDHVGELRIA